MSDDSTAQGCTGPAEAARPRRARPWWELGRRLLLAIGILVFTVLLVYFDRDGYNDANDPTARGRAWSTRSTTRPSR